MFTYVEMLLKNLFQSILPKLYLRDIEDETNLRCSLNTFGTQYNRPIDF